MQSYVQICFIIISKVISIVVGQKSFSIKEIFQHYGKYACQELDEKIDGTLNLQQELAGD